MNHWKPAHPDQFVGDPMPFSHDGVFHLFYLLDEGHHTWNDGLGGHQWAHASSRDLKNWTHHPLAIPVDEQDPITICTGSLIVHEGTWYAFYATRKLASGQPASAHTQHVSLATSPDGIHFTKHPGNPILTPPSRYWGRHFRDPHVWRAEDGLFHMLVTTCLAEEPVFMRGGCLAHLTSPDLAAWTWEEPFLTPGVNRAPECPDYFCWNGWYYLTFLHGTVLHYRTSRQPFGPWYYPPCDTIDCQLAAAFKTAPWGDRRLAVAHLRSRQDQLDTGKWLYAGHTIFRELIQYPDGTLGSRFVPEMRPPPNPPPLPAQTVAAEEGFVYLALDDIPADCRLTLQVSASPETRHFGLGLRGNGDCENGYELRFSPAEQRVRLHQLQRPLNNPGDRFDNGLALVSGLDRPFALEIIMHGSIIDVCIENRRTMIERVHELRGERLFFFAENGEVTFHAITLHPMENP